MLIIGESSLKKNVTVTQASMGGRSGSITPREVHVNDRLCGTTGALQASDVSVTELKHLGINFYVVQKTYVY